MQLKVTLFRNSCFYVWCMSFLYCFCSAVGIIHSADYSSAVAECCARSRVNVSSVWFAWIAGRSFIHISSVYCYCLLPVMSVISDPVATCMDIIWTLVIMHWLICLVSADCNSHPSAGYEKHFSCSFWPFFLFCNTPVGLKITICCLGHCKNTG